MITLPTPPPIPGAHWRALAGTDAPALHALLHALGLENGISPVEDAAYYAGVLNDPHADPTNNALGLFGEDSMLWAMVWVSYDPDTVESHRLDLWVDVHPAYASQGLANFLLRWTQARARQIAATLPEDRVVWMNIPTTWSQADRVARYEAAGFTARHSERFMRRDLHVPLPTLTEVSGITLVPWTPARDHLMRVTFNAAFADRPGARVIGEDSWARYLVSGRFEGDLSFIALEGNTGVGMVRSLASDAAPGEAEIGHVAVLASHRRRGIGRALMLQAMHGMHDAGHAATTLSVSVTNTPAQKAYEALGFVTSGGYTSYSKTIREAGHAAS